MRGMFPLDRILGQLTLANQLTLLRLAAIPAVAIALLSGSRGVALALYIGAAITDGLDGLAARRLGKQTALGAILDPAADKIMMTVTYVVLALPDRPRPFPDFELAHHIPAWLAILVVARDVIIVVVSLSLFLATEVRKFPPSRLSKWNTGVEMVAGALFLLANVWAGVPEPLLDFAVFVTGSLIVASGIGYILRMRRWGASTAR
jgi:cardiolipin synthase